MDDKLEKYAEQFAENFPLFMVRNLNEDEIIKIIDDCIESGKPYEPKDDDNDVIY